MMQLLTVYARRCLYAALVGVFTTGSPAVAADDADADAPRRIERIRNMVGSELRVLGHRNWVVVADSAYPSQAREAIKTRYVGGDQLAVVKAVLEAVDAAEHVQGKIYVDAEMKHVEDADAPGIERYRNDLAKLLGDRHVHTEPHIDIINKLDETAKTFHVLILKTDLTLPYTTVFIELDCGYWNAEKEAKLRAAIEAQ